MVGSSADVSTTTGVARAFPPSRNASADRRSLGGDGQARALHLIDLAGKTDLPTLAGVLAHCRALVTNDSGAMHLAAAAGVPVTAVFGPTNELTTGPMGDAHAIVTNDVWCRPCMLRECPLDHRCLRGVSAASVVAAARRTL